MESLRAKVEQHLTCPICLEQFKDPKVLPCLHSYCHECIVKLCKTENNITCPECRMTVEVGNPPDVSFLPSNFFAKNLLATLSLVSESDAANILCENCDSPDSAQTRCEQCNRYLCQFCTDSHGRFRDTRDHVLKSLDELKSGSPPIIAETIRCQKHKGEEIKLYCSTCQATICRDCTIVDHRQHEFSFVQDVASEKKDELLKLLDEVKERKTEVCVGITNVNEREKSIHAGSDSTISEVKKYFDNLIKCLEIRKSQLIEKTTSIKDSKHKQLQTQREELEISLANCESNIEFTEQALKNGNDVQILNMKKYISQSLESLKKKRNKIHPSVDDYIEFLAELPVNDLEDKVALLCNVVNEKKSSKNYTACFCTSGNYLKVGMLSKIEIRPKISGFLARKTSDESQRRTDTADSIEAICTGVTVKNLSVSANEFGLHNVSFIPLHVGMLKFEAYINGRLVPSCTLGRGVKLTFQSDGERAYSKGFGECILESGIHTWKINVKHEDCSRDERADFEVGVIDYDNHERKCVLDGYIKHEAQLSLKLDMSQKKLTVTPSWGKQISSEYQVTFPRASPFFTVDCDECEVSIIEMGPFSF